jgi:hypothetical protein
MVETKAEIRQIKKQLGEMKEVLHDIRSSSLLVAGDEEEEPNLKLPLSNFAELESLEEQLIDDRALKRHLVISYVADL